MSTPTCLKQDWGAGIASFSLRYSSQSKLPMYNKCTKQNERLMKKLNSLCWY